MKLAHGLHLAYCTNIHRGEDWSQTFEALQRHTLAVRDRVAPGRPYAIGLRLSDQASRELIQPAALERFRRWLEKENCYVFTVNAFPYGRFHGTRVKEQVYVPDWTSDARVQYTNRVFDILSEIVPEGIEGSVSTVPGSFKEFIKSSGQVQVMRTNLWKVIEHAAQLSARTGKMLHLGLEPEPLCFLETSKETVEFLDQVQDDRPGDPRLRKHLGVNYDACHLAVEFEDPGEAVQRFRDHGFRISKIHLSSALKLRPTAEGRQALRAFAEDVYLHQVIQKDGDGAITRYRDLDVALAERSPSLDDSATEWRIHFHIPLHCQPGKLFQSTANHLTGLLDLVQRDPGLCSHFEMETYTWEVMPPELKNRSVVDQLVSEYTWTLDQFAGRGLAEKPE
jgi:hypothetical protein